MNEEQTHSDDRSRETIRHQGKGVGKEAVDLAIWNGRIATSRGCKLAVGS